MTAQTAGERRTRTRIYALVTILAVLVLVVAYSLGKQERESARKTMSAPTGVIAASAAEEWAEYEADAVGMRAGAAMRGGRSGGGAMASQMAQAVPAVGAGFEAGAPARLPSDPMLIRTASLRLRVEDVAKAHEEVGRIAAEVDGYVADTTLNAETGPSSATITIRVPSRGLESVMDRVVTLGKLLEKRMSTQEVSEEYVDLGSRKRNLEREEQQLLELLKRAGKIPDLLQVEQTLARVRGEVERIAGRMRYLENRVALSAVTVRLEGPEPKATAGGPVWAASDVFRQATRSLIRTGRGLATMGIWLGVYIPVWLPILVVLALVIRRASTPRREPQTNTGS
jgi:hypothetical protein